jgi:hypothetical protein
LSYTGCMRVVVGVSAATVCAVCAAWLCAAAVAGCSFDYDTASWDGGAAPVDSSVDVAEAALDVADVLPDSLPPIDGADDALDASGTDASDAVLDVPPKTCAALGGTTYGGHCYWPLGTASTQADAVTACKTADPAGHLVTITSPGEEKFVATYAATGARWIGLQAPSPTTVKALFTWITLEPKVVEYWLSTAPSGAGACVRINSLGQWVDRACTGLSLALCERDSP